MAKKGGIADIAKGRSDTYRLSVSDLNVKDGWNCRDLQTPEAQADLRELAASIKEVGVKQTMTVYWEDGKAFLTDGHRRYFAAKIAIDELGADPDLTVPVMTEPRTADEAERTFSQIIRNSGKPLTPLEQGEVFKRLVGFGWTDTEIARRSGLSRVHVANLVALVDAPKVVTNMVRSGEVSSTLAITTLNKNKGNAKAAASELKDAVKTAKKAGKTRATAKHVKAAKKGKEKPDKAPADPKAELKAILTEHPLTTPDALTVPDRDDVYLIPVTAESWDRVCAILGIGDGKTKLNRDTDLI